MQAQRSRQEGVMLLEAMIGILIFSLGVLALVAMQAFSISSVSNAQFRSEAALLANDIIASAWVDRCTTPCTPTGNVNNLPNYRVPGGNAAAVVAWQAKVTALLPQSATYPPTIAVVTNPDNSATLTVTLRWKAPEALAPSNHVAVTVIAEP